MSYKFRMRIIFLVVLYLRYCEAKLDTTWWRHTNIYELVVHAFKDSNRDGIGDLKGIKSMLPHLADLKIETLYLTPFFETNMIDMGYDIKDYCKVDPRFGTMADFDELIKEMIARGMKMILDLVINHTSDQHEWFLKSVRNIEPYTDYYVWKNPNHYVNGYATPPNNWYSWAGSVAWTWNDERKKFYYHAFTEQQVDLNLKNPKVKEEIKNIMEFWLDKGVSGFRLDAPMNYIEDDNLKWNGQRDQKESFDFIYEMRIFLDGYNNKHGGYERIFVAEAPGEPEIAVEYYGKKNHPICHMPCNYYFRYNTNELLAWDLNNLIHGWLSCVPEGESPLWVSDDHDSARTGTRIRSEYIDINLIATSMLPGTVQYYYGAEIGLDSGYIRENQKTDQLGNGGRDPHRLIMQWDDSLNSGFSRNMKTFLPSSADYTRNNVKIQKNLENSHYNMMKNLNILRKTKTLIEGDFVSHVYSFHVYIFWRSLQGHPTYIVVFNLADSESEIDLSKVFNCRSFPLTVEAASANAHYEKKQIISGEENCKFIMKPISAIVLRTSKYLVW